MSYERIAELRKAAGLTQKEVAEKLGTNPATYARLELGHRRLTADWMEALAPVFGVKPYELMVDINGIEPPGGEADARLRATLAVQKEFSASHGVDIFSARKLSDIAIDAYCGKKGEKK